MFLLFSINLIYAKFDSLRALKKEVAKDDQSEKGKAKTKEFFFPIDAISCCVFFAKLGKVGLTSFLKHTQHGHLGIAGENHMIFPQLIFIFNFLASSFASSTLFKFIVNEISYSLKKKKKTRRWKGFSPKLLHLQVLYNQTNHFQIVACHPLNLIVQINHTCSQIGDFSFLFLLVVFAFMPMPCYYQCRIEGTPLYLPIMNVIYVSIVKLQNCSAQLSIGLSKLRSG